MCEFCKNVKTGNDLNTILNTTCKLGDFGELESYVYLTKANGKPIIALESLGTNWYNAIVDNMNINYCPMCGERL